VSLVVQPVVLEGSRVQLEPLADHHAEALFAVGRQAEDWLYMPRGCFTSEADCRDWIAEALATQAHRPFAVVERASGRTVGSTRYLNIRAEHRGLEIGWTWLGREWQRTAVNTETKLLLLAHAFEALGCIRVEFKTDERNTRSQAALERIGAVREGVLRQHMIVQQEYRRNSVYYSIIDNEWPAVKARLEARLAGS
jgi:RimJ/RimL family protein N-acetyltransferase